MTHHATRLSERDIAEEFPLAQDLCHLNHAAVGPWPARTAAAVSRFAQENASQGSLGYLGWLQVEQRLRERLSRLIGADSTTAIALSKNTSEALSIIAHGLPWERGDSIVGIAQEFPSNRIVWESLSDQGVTWRGLDLDRSQDPETELMALCDAQTRLVAVSWIQYAGGLRLDLSRLGKLCKARGILLCVDAIQGLGAVPFSLREIEADFIVADGHKWMLGPEGVALLYVRPSLQERLRLHQFGWHMVEHCGDFSRTDWAPATDAKRFECGSPNLLGTHALEASLSLLEDVGAERIWEQLQQRAAHLIDLIDRRGFELLTPRASDRRAGIITFRVPGRASEQLYPQLMAKRVLCAARGGGIRFSPHFYTAFEVMEGAMDALDDILASGSRD